MYFLMYQVGIVINNDEKSQYQLQHISKINKVYQIGSKMSLTVLQVQIFLIHY